MRSALPSHQLRRLMETVYGSWQGSASVAEFPLPLREKEAGPCQLGQRRYLWTDSFAVLNFLSMAHHYSMNYDKNGEKECIEAAKKLVKVVEETLGYPRPGNEFSMCKRSDGREGFVGWRIGKANERSFTDPGMRYDGQYWHYVDKFLFAKSRLALYLEDKTLIHGVILDAKELLQHFLSFDGNGLPQGIHWKLNSDMRPIEQLGRPRPNGDAVSAYVIYNVIQATANKLGFNEASLEKEIENLRPLAVEYANNYLQFANPVLVDSLGWGLNLLELQWMGPLESKAKVVDHLCELKHKVIDGSHQKDLAFRLYGAVLGGLLSENKETVMLSKSIVTEIEGALTHNENADQSPDSNVHGLFSINRVMFCSCIDPWAFRRQSHEGILDVFSPLLC